MKIEDRAASASGTGQVGLPTASAHPVTSGAAADPTARQTRVSERPAATVELSDRARELHAALRAVQDAPDVRADVVADVRRRLTNGAYRLDAEATARDILDRRA